MQLTCVFVFDVHHFCTHLACRQRRVSGTMSPPAATCALDARPPSFLTPWSSWRRPRPASAGPTSRWETHHIQECFEKVMVCGVGGRPTRCSAGTVCRVHRCHVQDQAGEHAAETQYACAWHQSSTMCAATGLHLCAHNAQHHVGLCCFRCARRLSSTSDSWALSSGRRSAIPSGDPALLLWAPEPHNALLPWLHDEQH
jgi:hypothetical protein